MEQGCPPALPDPVCIQDRLAPEPSDSAPQQQKKEPFHMVQHQAEFCCLRSCFQCLLGLQASSSYTHSLHVPGGWRTSFCILYLAWPLDSVSFSESKSIILHVEITLRSDCSFRQYPPSTLRSQFIAKGFTVELQFE